MVTISKIKLCNFKRFKTLEIPLNKVHNIFIGDNESGKSSILLAIDIVLSGSRHKIEKHGLKNLFNANVISNYLASDRKIENLPKLYIELFLDGVVNDDKLYGRTNSTRRDDYGLRLLVEPDTNYHKEMNLILAQGEDNFPFEYYSVTFKAFSDQAYISYTKFFKHLLIDSTQINNKTATAKYVHNLYDSHVDKRTQIMLKNEYRKRKISFQNENLDTLSPNSTYNFSIKSNSESNLQTDLTIEEEGITIENKGKGRQCLIKIDFALNHISSSLDFVLLEEPENHLSHLSMRKMIQTVNDLSNCQIFIATHNNLICNRLDLRNALLLNQNSMNCISLKDLSKGTAGFFIKAPDNNILEYVLSSKVILVEGDAEFMLIKHFFEKISQTSIEKSMVHVISVGGIKFKRYIEIGNKLKIKTAIITDNDKDYVKKITENYKGLSSPTTEIFAHKNDKIHTFEVAIYAKNKGICDDLFKEGRRTLEVSEYMLQNKADAAYKLLENKADKIVCPDYIKEAIEWIIK